MKFKELLKEDVSTNELTIRNSWTDVNVINDKQTKARENNENFVFYDGPATANGMPGVHHILAK